MRQFRLAQPSDFTSGSILLGLAMLRRQTAPRSDPPTRSYGIMGRAYFTTERNARGKNVHGELAPGLELANSQDRELHVRLAETGFNAWADHDKLSILPIRG
jgi:hypothetical protein